MILPLAKREFSKLSRQKSAYSLRAVGPVLCVSIILLVRPETYAFMELIWPGFQRFAVQFAGISSVNVITFMARLFQYLVVFVFAPLLSAGLIASEKEERTLGLLLISSARRTDLVLSKYTVCLLFVALLVLSTLPVSSFASFFGGVTLWVQVVQMMWFMMGAATVCALGLLAGTIARQPREALLLAIMFEAAWGGSTYLIDRTMAPGGTWVSYSLPYLVNRVEMLPPPTLWLSLIHI